MILTRFRKKQRKRGLAATEGREEGLNLKRKKKEKGKASIFIFMR
jgi:hypothetical protein